MNYKEASKFEFDGIAIPDFDNKVLLEHLIEAMSTGRRYFAFALHINALLNLKNPSYLSSLQSNCINYVDGISVLIPLKIKKIQSLIKRYPTTDLGHDLIKKFTNDNGVCRVALVGGNDGLSVKALAILEELHECKGVFSCSGFEADWELQISGLVSSSPNIVFVGMGSPLEVIWCRTYEDFLPNCLIVTCGGWFSFLTKDEIRAPLFMQRIGLEWFWRFIQSPTRLFKRYFVGLFYVMKYVTIWRKNIKYVRDK